MADSLAELTHIKMMNMAKQLGIQDRIIEGQKEQLERLAEIIALQEAKYQAKQDESDEWKKQFKRQRAQKIGMVGIFVVVTGTLIVLQSH